MAVRRNIFRTAFMKAGRLLGAWTGWTADWRRMCWLWEHLEGRNGIEVGWDADGSCYLDGRMCGGYGSGRAPWQFDAKSGAFLRPYVMGGNAMFTVTAGNAGISLPSPGSTASYHVHMHHGASGQPTAELVTTAGANTDTDTYIWVADLGPAGQTGGIYSMPCLPLYSW